MSAIFISHSSADNAAADRLREQLAAGGFKSVFVDFDKERGILPGQAWEEVLYRRIRSCQAVIALVSKDSLGSDWCKTEIRQARALHKKIIPALLDDSDLSSLAEIQFADLRGTDRAEDYAPLLKALNAAKVTKGAWDGVRSPYPGLLSFEEEDAGVFFGREAAIEDGLQRMAKCLGRTPVPWFVLLGASGSGKSSFLQAGILPRLRTDARKQWLVVGPLRRGKDPYGSLAVAFAGAFRRFGREMDPIALATTLGSADAAALANLAGELRLVASQPGATTVVIVDQFEELLVKSGSAAPEPERTAGFLGLLRRLGELDGSPFLVLATLRADFLGAFQTHPTIRGLDSEELIVKPLDDDALPRVIMEPAILAGVAFEEGLVDEIVRDTKEGAALPLLAFALREMYERFGEDGLIGQREYREGLGGLYKAVARRAEEVLAEILAEGSPNDERELRRAFLSLVQLGDERRAVRRTVRWKEFQESVRGKLEKFVAARLLVSGGGEEPDVEVAHEALFSSWPRLEAWIRESQGFLAWRKRLDPLVEAWTQASQRSERLLHRPELGEAESWLTKEGGLLSDGERDFILASLLAERSRKRWVWTAVASTFTVVLVVAGLAVWKAQEAAEQRDIADQRRRTATARQLVSESVVRTTSTPDAALLFALEALATEDSIEARGNLMRVLDATSSIASYLHAPMVGVESTTFSPDGRFIAGILGDSLYLWSTATRNLAVPPLVAASGIQGSLFGAVFSPRGDSIAAYGLGRVTLWDLSGKRLHTYPVSGTAWDIAFHPREHVLAAVTRPLVVGSRPAIELWDTDAHRSIGRLEAAKLAASPNLAFSRDGRLLAASGVDGSIVVWKWELQAQPDAYALGDEEVKLLAFSPRDDLLAFATESGDVGVVDFATRRIARLPHNVPVQRMAFSRKGDVLATGDASGDVRFWNLATYRPDPHVHHLGSTTLGLSFGPTVGDLVMSAHDSPVALSRSGEGFLAERRACARGLEGSSIAYSQAAGFVGVSCSDGSVSVFRLNAAPAFVHTLVSAGGHGGPLAFSPDGKQVALLDCMGPNRFACASQLRVWSTDGWTEMSPRLEAKAGQPKALAVGGRMIAGGTFEPDGKVYLWDATDFHDLGALPIDAEVETVLFSSDEATLVVSTYDGTVAEWDVRDRKLRRGPARWHDKPVITLALSPGGAALATGSGDRTIRFVDARTFTPLGVPMKGHDNSVFGLAFLDEATLASASYDGSVALWDLVGRKMVGRVYRKDSPQKGLVFAPSERVLASVGEDGSLNVAPVGLDAWRQRACAAANRNLSESEWAVAHPGEPYRRTCPTFPTHPSVIDAALEPARAGDVERTTERLRALVAQDPELKMDPVATARMMAAEAAFRTAATAQDVELALASYAKGRALSGPSQPDATVLNSLCWKGALHGKAVEVAEICDAAVERATEQDKPLVRDSRAVARALRGDLAGAALDLVAFVATPGVDPKAVALRSELLAALRQGRNPYDAEMLERLRAE